MLHVAATLSASLSHPKCMCDETYISFPLLSSRTIKSYNFIFIVPIINEKDPYSHFTLGSRVNAYTYIGIFWLHIVYFRRQKRHKIS